jgi:hypothetical protein
MLLSAAQFFQHEIREGFHMGFIAVVAAALLTQAPTQAAPAAAAEPAALSAGDRAALAAEKAAESAEKAAVAVQRIADALAPPAPAPGAPAPASKGWTIVAGAGLSFITGNAQTLTLTGSLALDRKWEVWALGIRASGAYGLTNPNPTTLGTIGAVTARRAAASVRGDRSFNAFVALYVQAGTEFDHVKNVESRSVGELGVSFTLVNKKEGDVEKVFLRLDAGLRGGVETRYQYFPVPAAITPSAAPLLAPRANAAFRWAINGNFRFTEEVEFIPFVLSPSPAEPAGRLLINSTTKVAAKIVDNVALAVGLLINYDSQPPPSTPVRLNADFALTAGVEATF